MKLKTLAKKVAMALLALLMFFVGIVLMWELVRPTVVSYFESPTIVVPEQLTDFELYVARSDVQEELELMWKRHQRDTLTNEITELETSKR